MAIRPQFLRASCRRLRSLFGSRTQVLQRFACRLRLPRAARGRGDIVGPAVAASEGSPLTVRGVRPVLQASVQAALRALHFRGMIAPNNSFNPNPLQIGRATSELQSLMRISYAVFCLKKTKKSYTNKR